MKRIRLATPLRYHFNGKLYEEGIIYGVKDGPAAVLLSKKDPTLGTPYFEEVTKAKLVDEAVPAVTVTPKTVEEIEAELEASNEDFVVISDSVRVEDLKEGDLI